MNNQSKWLLRLVIAVWLAYLALGLWQTTQAQEAPADPAVAASQWLPNTVGLHLGTAHSTSGFNNTNPGVTCAGQTLAAPARCWAPTTTASAPKACTPPTYGLGAPAVHQARPTRGHCQPLSRPVLLLATSRAASCRC